MTRTILKHRASRAPIEILAWVLTLIVLVPFALIVLGSVKTTAEAARFDMSLPARPVFENYAEAFAKGKIAATFFNSLLYSAVSTLISNICAAMASFVMARANTRFFRAANVYFFLGLVAVTNYVTTVEVMSKIHLLNTRLGMILLFASQGISFSVFLFYGFIKTIPRTLDEAAMLDGCNSVRLFINVIFPLLKPVAITGIVLNFMGAWNDYITPLYVLNKTSGWGMIMAMYNFFGLHAKEWNQISAVIIMTVFPILIIFIICQRYIVAGMTTGSVKG